MATELVRQKRKYFEKTLSRSAVDSIYLRILDLEDFFSEITWQYMPMFIYLDISSLFIFGLEPFELEPLNIEFRIELPSIDEWLQGIKLKFIKVDIGESWKQFFEEYFKQIVSPVLDFDTFVTENVIDEYVPDILKRKYTKLIVGETKYGEGYVDPPVIRNLLRSTWLELFKRRPDFERLHIHYEHLAKKLNIAPFILEQLYNRIALMHNALYENFILGYGILGISKLSERKEDGAKLTIVTWRKETIDSKYFKMSELQAALILGIIPLGLGLLLPREYFYKGTSSIGTPRFVWFIDWKTRRAISRFRATHLGFANYQRWDEMDIYYKSERAEQYYALRTFTKIIDDLVETLLLQEHVSVFDLNLYKRAANMLIGHRKKRHKWGYDMFKQMTEEEFKAWWLDYWERQGLNIDLLNKIYERLKICLPRLRENVKSLGEYLKKKRERLARYYAK